MPEPVASITAIAACGSLIAIVLDKMKSSRCTRIICCGCCEIDRDVKDTTIQTQLALIIDAVT